MSLQGNLTDLPLEDLLQVFTVQSKSGILFISYGSYQAEICFNKALLHSAIVYNTATMDTSACQQGEDALYDVLRWPEGQFHFELESIPPSPRNIFKSAEYIILEFCRRRDECDTEKQFEQQLNLRPCLLPDPPVASQINLELEQWRLLLQVDGQSTITEIAYRIQQEAVAVAKTFEELIKKGLVELKAPVSVVNNKQWQPSGNGEFYQTRAEINAKLELSYRYETVAYTNSPIPHTAYGYTATPSAQNYIQALPAGTAMPIPNNNFGYVPESSPSAVGKPKVRRGLLSGIVAKIRGL